MNLSISPKLALLILSWQVACLYHKNETDSLLEGSLSATNAESAVLDKIHDTIAPEIPWDEFNATYAKFNSAKERAAVCIDVLKDCSDDLKKLTLKSMLEVANASNEDGNENNVSPAEYGFIDMVKVALAIDL